MDSVQDPAPQPRRLAPTVDRAVKILVVGATGVGKSTLVRSVSEIEPLRTEETLDRAGTHAHGAAGVEATAPTTVAMDFGRITLDPRTVLYVFGAPGQRRIRDLWEGLFTGVLGLLVVVDTRRLAESFDVLDQLDLRGLPFAVAVNQFPDSASHDDADLRDALDLLPETPLVRLDARSRDSSTQALTALVQYAARIKAQEKVA